ncbi:peptide deformylase [Rickettsia oklahomensis]|uniref:Peptide deformylase n=1 Tax=Rickettsia oklahomensis TaxID=3141789 RepID=A0AAU7BX92_9RICK
MKNIITININKKIALSKLEILIRDLKDFEDKEKKLKKLAILEEILDKWEEIQDEMREVD